tara:strand:- start:212 stop:514 length:303 start_codon:yes stop_codon:yes gene_type:complete
MITTRNEMVLLRKIADRAKVYAAGWNKAALMLTIEKAHGHIPLDLGKLLASTESEFLRDVFGIAYHLNKKTGKIESHFVPRCALPWQPSQKPKTKTKTKK